MQLIKIMSYVLVVQCIVYNVLVVLCVSNDT